jgi:hypothetical protein
VVIKPGIANSTGSAPANTAANQVVIPFNIEVGGTYNFLGRAIGPSPTEDSYWVKVDNGAFVSANGLTSSTWQWGRMAIADLAPGPHTFTITYREVGARLDKILLTTSNSSIITPEILGPNCGVAPVIPQVSFPIDGGVGHQLGTITATDADDLTFPGSTIFQKWKIVGGTGAGIFTIDASTGKLSVANASAIDFSKTGYTVRVTVSDGYFTSNEQDINITISKKIRVCHKNKNVLSIGKMDVHDHLAHGDYMGECPDPTVSARSVRANEAANNLIVVYPNPAKDNIYVSLGAGFADVRKIEVFELTSGRLVKNLSTQGKTNISIPRGNLASGMYLLKITGKAVSTKKLLLE